ncbi:MAG: pantoate--beta-alanine ligase [Pikeienuella sp.]
METVRRVADLRAWVAGWRQAGARIALVPTMGALHQGHLSLVTAASARADRVVASIFVNPTQFGAGEDFTAYPRDESRDAAMLAQAGCALLFAPGVDEMYPAGFGTEVRVRGLTEVLCGAARPGHFDGVAQIVTKLLNQARADLAVFGEKDWQQLAVIRRLALDLDLGTEILGVPTLRDPDGLALSSRNRYLTATERSAAPTLYRAIAQAAEAIAAGAAPDLACAAARARVATAGFAAVDYLECRDAESLTLVSAAPPTRPARVFAAARLGRARLIDNTPVPPAPGAGSTANAC